MCLEMERNRELEHLGIKQGKHLLCAKQYLKHGNGFSLLTFPNN